MEGGREIPVHIIGPIVNSNDDEKFEYADVEAEELAKSLNQHINRGSLEISGLPPRRASDGSPRPGRVESRGSGSNRTSLVVTHEDGSVEDLETEVTCLGLSMDSAWGAAGTRGGLTIQELGEDHQSLNSFLSDIGGEEEESFYDRVDPIYASVKEEDEEEGRSGSSTPELIPTPCEITAEIHPVSSNDVNFTEKQDANTNPSKTFTQSRSPSPTFIERKPNNPLSGHNPFSGVQIVSLPSTPSPTPSIDMQLTPTSTNGKDTTHPNSQNTATMTSSLYVHIDRLPPTPSPSPPSQLSTPSPPSSERISPPSPTPIQSPSPSPIIRPISPPPPRPTSPPPPLPPSHLLPPSKSPPASLPPPQSKPDREAPSSQTGAHKFNATHSSGGANPQLSHKESVTVVREESATSEKIVTQEMVKQPEEASTDSSMKVLQVPIECPADWVAPADPKSRQIGASFENTNIHAHNAAGAEVKQTEKKETMETIGTTEYRHEVTRGGNMKNRNSNDLDRQESRQNNRSSAGAVPIRIIPISLPDGRVIERKAAAQTRIDIEFTEINDTLHKKEQLKESVTKKFSCLNNNGDISQETELRNASNELAQKHGSNSLRENCNGNISTKESVQAWQSTLDTACKTPPVKSEVGVTKERIIPISLVRDQAPTQGNKEEKPQSWNGKEYEGGFSATSGSLEKKSMTPLCIPTLPNTSEDNSKEEKDHPRVTFRTNPTSPTTPTSPVTTFSKPPLQGVRIVPILRNPETAAKTGVRMRNKSESSKPGDQEELKRLTAELEESHSRLQAQARDLGDRNARLMRTETRSRSVEADRREAQVRQRYPGLRRERSLQDIDKDIETIWRELQELDKLPLDRPSSTAPLPLSEQHLVSPPWRRPAAPSTSPQPPQHYSFLPRAETRPGAIIPSYVSPSPRTARAAFLATQTHDSPATRGRQGKPEGSHVLETNFPAEANNQQACQPSGQQASQPSSQSSIHTPRNTVLQTGNLYNSTKNSSYTSSVNERSTSQTRGAEGLKSCLKSESRSSSTTRSSDVTRSESPGGRESPAKQGVNFRTIPNVKTFQQEPTIPLNGNHTSNSGTDIQPYDWVDVGSSGVGSKAKLLSNGMKEAPVSLTKEEPKKVERIVPIQMTEREGRSKSWDSSKLLH